MSLTAPEDDWIPTPKDTPFDRIGGEAAVIALAEEFYDQMEQHEPELARLHPLDEQGRVSRGSRERFGLFLVGWLGGPQHYMQKHGHPRLRMRHGHLPVNEKMRDAWTHSMRLAMDARGIKGGLRKFLDSRFADVADFLRNMEG